MAKYISLAAFQSTRPAALKQWNGLKKNDLAKLLPERTVAKALNEVREKAPSYKRTSSAPAKPASIGKLLNKVKRLHEEDRARALRIKEASAEYLAGLKEANAPECVEVIHEAEDKWLENIDEVCARIDAAEAAYIASLKEAK